MKEAFLIEPNKKHRKSFEKYALAYKMLNDEHYYDKYKKALDNFQDYLSDLENYSKGNNLSQGEAV